METAVHQNELQTLGQWLLRELQSDVTQPSPLQLQCALKQEMLLILVQHLPEVVLDEENLFARLEHAVRQINPALIERIAGIRDTVPVRLYLRIVGQPQPYRFKVLALEAAIAPLTNQPPLDFPEISLDSVASEATDTISAAEELLQDATERAIAPPVPAPPLSPSITFVNQQEPRGFLSWLASIPIVERIPVSALVFSSIVGLFTLGSGLYVLTRPCVVGDCPPLGSAQRLSQQSAQLVQPTASPQDVAEAYHQMLEANYLLGTIPPWSAHHATAQALLKTYEARAEGFGKVVRALQQANTAAEKSQAPPHPLATWRAIQEIWQGAIALLETVPADSPIDLLRQRKLAEYQNNLSSINQRILAEQQAQQQVTAARSAAQIAENRAAAAKSLEGWQLAHLTWQTVVSALQNVPRGTMAYAEAEQLLAIYQPKLASAGDRYIQEKVSADAYSQALVFAERARQSEQRRQWSQAVEQWQDALKNVQQVPDDTSYHNQVQLLILSYQTALTAAQTNLRTAIVTQTTESNLNRVCRGTTIICTYTLGTDAIQVHLTSDYDWAVQSVVANAQLAGDTNTQQALRDYVNGLLRTFATVSQQSQTPLDLYNAQDKIFSTYDPRLGGFVQR